MSEITKDKIKSAYLNDDWDRGEIMNYYYIFHNYGSIINPNLYNYRCDGRVDKFHFTIDGFKEIAENADPILKLMREDTSGRRRADDVRKTIQIVKIIKEVVTSGEIYKWEEERKKMLMSSYNKDDIEEDEEKESFSSKIIKFFKSLM